MISIKHKGIRLAILVVLLFSTGLNILSSTFKSIIIPNENTYNSNESNLKSAGFWDLTGSLILIDDSDPGKDWAYTALNYDWCSGSGSWTDPYLIENVTIDGLPFSNCIEIRNSNTYFIIRNCTLIDPHSQYFGIYLFNTNNSKLMENYCSDQNEAGIYLDQSYNNTLSRNVVSGYPGNGIELFYSDNNTLSGNTINVYWYGIYLDYSHNNTLSGNTAENHFVGIRFDYSNDNTLSENTANNNKNGFGIINSHYNALSGNNASNNDFVGIQIGSYSHNNTLSGNTANNNSEGLYLEFSDNNKISGNTINNNEEYGIKIWFANNNTMSGNILNNNQRAITLIVCSNNTLSGNLMEFCGISLYGSLVMMASHSIDTSNLVNNKTVYYYVNERGLETSDFTNAGQIIMVNCNVSMIAGFNLSDGTVGILLIYSHNNTISGNTVENNSFGIFLNNSHNNTLSENTVENNSIGKFLSYSHNNTLSGNTVNNNEKGIRLSNSNSSMFYENFIQNNEEHGVYINTGTQNLFFQNYFINNTVHAYDDGIYNYWNNSEIGNFWDNYTGPDFNDDGIGDILHVISTSPLIQDFLPIWDDGDDLAPQITINTPIYYDLMGKKTPTFDIKITEQALNSTWYRLWNGTKLTNNNTFEYLIDNEIEQKIWNDIGNGTVTITFFANDSSGKISSKNVTVRKDIFNPIITVNKPMEGDLFGIKSPSADDFNVTFNDPNSIDYKWYMLSNESYNTDNHTWNGYIEQQFWNDFFNGTIKIIIFSNDSVGNIGFVEISIEKDVTFPILVIHSPEEGDVFRSEAPSFNITVIEKNFLSSWYSLDRGVTNFSITDNLGNFNQTAWNNAPSGDVIITFYVSDKVGNIAFKEISVTKSIPETTIPGYNLALIIAVVGIIYIVLVLSPYNKRKIKK